MKCVTFEMWFVVSESRVACLIFWVKIQKSITLPEKLPPIFSCFLTNLYVCKILHFSHCELKCGNELKCFGSRSFNTLRTGDADLRFYVTTVQDGWRRFAFLTRWNSVHRQVLLSATPQGGKFPEVSHP